jgi:transcriptional regulator with XRE-family HTH domain
MTADTSSPLIAFLRARLDEIDQPDDTTHGGSAPLRERLAELATLIVNARHAKGWTQQDLAEEAGISRPTVNRYEQGKTTTPDPGVVWPVTRALGLDPRRVAVLLGYVTDRDLAPRAGGELILLLMAQPFSRHPDFEPSWLIAADT